MVSSAFTPAVVLIFCIITTICATSLEAAYAGIANNGSSSTCKCVPRSEVSSLQDEYVLRCHREKLSSIPLITCEGTVHSLDLTGNYLTSVDIMGGGNGLKVLHFSENKIKTLEPEAFETVPYLEELYLDNNEIEELQTTTFYELRNLVILDLRKNRLSRLPPELFNSQTKLETLKLADNPLRYFDVSQFQQLTALKTLDLRNIQCHHLPAGMFHGLYNLATIDLSDNEFEEVPIDALRSAPKLKELVFDNNLIKNLNSKSFTKLTTLEILRINANRKLGYIGRSTFSWLTGLKKLYIESNPMLSIISPAAFSDYSEPDHAFTFHISVQEVHMKQNALSNLSKNILPWPAVRLLDVRGNPWYCSCELDWLREKLIEQSQAEVVAGVTCAGPNLLRGKDIVALEAEDLLCEKDHELNGKDVIIRTFIVIMTITVSVFTLSLIMAFMKKKGICFRSCYTRKGTGSVYYVKAHTNPIDVAADI